MSLGLSELQGSEPMATDNSLLEQWIDRYVKFSKDAAPEQFLFNIAKKFGDIV